ncbi:MAG TPA: hypothetical protein VGK73_23320 [Polyangiaceae bacterium]
MSIPESELDTRLLAAYLERQTSADETRRVEEALVVDAGARRRLAQLEELTRALGSPLPELESIDLLRGVRKALSEPALKPRGVWRLSPWCVGLAATLASAAAWLVAISPRESSDSEFRSKSGAAEQSDGRRWAGIQVHRVSGASQAVRANERFAASDDLVISYTNRGVSPFEYLSVFAVDDRGNVHWFYPAYEHLGADPASIVIEKAVTERALPDRIHHEFAAERISIYGLFSRRALRVSEVEAWIRKQGGRVASDSPFPDTSLHTLTLRVLP